MAIPRECPKCLGAMSEGFILDNSDGALSPSGWVAGAPVRSMWFGVKIGKTKPIDIKSMRCERCGFLENYAPA